MEQLRRLRYHQNYRPRPDKASFVVFYAYPGCMNLEDHDHHGLLLVSEGHCPTHCPDTPMLIVGIGLPFKSGDAPVLIGEFQGLYEEAVRLWHAYYEPEESETTAARRQ